LTSTSRQPEAIQILLPVWGHRFVIQFLELSMPTLMAPGNIPALAKELPCKFVFMTTEDDAELIQGHPTYRRLSEICTVELQFLDDLVVDGNHSATITLAFARAMRAAGPAMLKTCFFFPVSDYVVADGSLKNVLERIRAGFSGVFAGNFQVTAEEAGPVLRKWIPGGCLSVSLAARELVGWSLDHLHPATIANMVNVPLAHNAHTNRLFWRVDDHTMLARFFLMHPIAIHPEVTEFEVGSSFDYSFVPELCPSNNVTAMLDSDDYLVIEMQPSWHENQYLRFGQLSADELAVSLSEWTTARHRQNSKFTLIYRGGEVSPDIGRVREQADAFLAEVERHISAAPQPYRQHPYWIGSMAAFRESRRRIMQNLQSSQDYALPERDRFLAFLWSLRFRLFGQAPKVTPLHPLWPDFYLLEIALSKMNVSGNRVLVASDRLVRYSGWVDRPDWKLTHLEIPRLLAMPALTYAKHPNPYDGCILFVSNEDVLDQHLVLDSLAPMLRPGSEVLIFLFNSQIQIRKYLRQFFSIRFLVKDTLFIEIGSIRRAVQSWLVELAVRLRRSPYSYFLLGCIAGGPLILASLITNRFSIRTLSKAGDPKRCSSVAINLKFEAQAKRGSTPHMDSEPAAEALMSDSKVAAAVRD
jgi:hypothetical protein